MKPRFNIEDYPDRDVAMHCPNVEDATIFLEYLDSIGRTWINGDRYRNPRYNNYDSQTAYAFNRGQFGSVDFYLDNDYEVLSFGNFDWNEFDISEKEIKAFDKFLASFTVSA